MKIAVQNNTFLVDGKYPRNPSAQWLAFALQSGREKILEELEGRGSRVALAFLGRDPNAILWASAYANFMANNMHWAKIKRSDLLPDFADLWEVVEKLGLKYHGPRIVNTTVCENEAGVHLFVCPNFAV